MSQHVASLKANYTVFGALMALLVVTVGAAYVDLGPFNLPVSLLIASVKVVMIVLVFMHVRYSHRLTWVFAGASLLWLAILILLTLVDYHTRGWLPIEGK